MYKADLILFSAREIKASPLKSLLMIFSFSIGIAIPVFVFGISNGMKEQVEQLGKETFRKKLSIYANQDRSSTYTPTLDDLSYLSSKMYDIEAIGALKLWSNKLIHFENKFFRTDVAGLSPQALKAMAQKTISGKDYIDDTSYLLSNECIINETLFHALNLKQLPVSLNVSGFECFPVSLVTKEPYTRDKSYIYFSMEAISEYYKSQNPFTEDTAFLNQRFDKNNVNRIAVLFSDYDSMLAQLDEVIGIISSLKESKHAKPRLDNLVFQKMDKEKHERTLDNLETFLTNIMIIVVSFISFTVGLNSYHSVKVKMKDISVQVALGASSFDIIKLQTMELIITIVCGSLLGTSISIYLAEPLMTNSNFRISIDTLVLVKSFLIMTLGAMLSSLIPMYLISKTDPSSALKGA